MNKTKTRSGEPPAIVGPGWVAVVEALWRLEQEPYHWPVVRTSFQKIAYFATESGIPTGLHFQRGSFGPHAAELKRKITALVNNGLIWEQQLGKMFAIRVGRTFPDAQRAYRKQLDEWGPAIDRITDLFMRMNTQQAETAATVHFAARELQQKLGKAPRENDVVHAVMDWKVRRRPPLNAKEVAVTIRRLNILGWITAEVSEDLPVPEEERMYA